MKQIPTIYNLNFNDELDYLSFITASENYRKDIISVINLQSDFKIAKDRINGYKRGLKNLLEFREAHDFDDFWNELLIPNLSKKYSVPIKIMGTNAIPLFEFYKNHSERKTYLTQEMLKNKICDTYIFHHRKKPFDNFFSYKQKLI